MTPEEYSFVLRQLIETVEIAQSLLDRALADGRSEWYIRERREDLTAAEEALNALKFREEHNHPL